MAESLLATLRRERAEAGATDARLDWIEEALEETLSLVSRLSTNARGELAMSAPGTWDYDYATDTLAWVKRAEATVVALTAEHQCLTGRAARRRETPYVD